MKNLLLVTLCVLFLFTGCAQQNVSTEQKESENVSFLLEENQSLKDQLKEYTNSAVNTAELNDSVCSQDQCMFTTENSQYGLASIQGYYIEEEKTAWEVTEKCDVFVITGGSELLIKYFVDLVNSGNSVNSLNKSGQPVINLSLNGLEDNIINKVKSSGPDKNVDLLVLLPKRLEMEAPVCYSFVEILRVK